MCVCVYVCVRLLKGRYEVFGVTLQCQTILCIIETSLLFRSSNSAATVPFAHSATRRRPISSARTPTLPPSLSNGTSTPLRNLALLHLSTSLMERINRVIIIPPRLLMRSMRHRASLALLSPTPAMDRPLTSLPLPLFTSPLPSTPLTLSPPSPSRRYPRILHLFLPHPLTPTTHRLTLRSHLLPLSLPRLLRLSSPPLHPIPTLTISQYAPS